MDAPKVITTDSGGARYLIPNRNISENEDYARLWALLLKQPLNGQATGFEEMRIVVPLVEKLEKVPLTTDDSEPAMIQLSEVEYDLVVERVTRPTFATNTRPILDMIYETLSCEKQ